MFCSWRNRIEQRLDRIERKLDALIAGQRLLIQQESELMSKITDALDAAEAAAKQNSDAEDAVEALLTTLSQQIAALKQQGDDPAVVARIQALSDALSQKANGLAAAVVANTPAA